MKQKNLDFAIIGGGASGIMAAIGYKKANPSKRVCIFEKNSQLGKKILVSGAGRCNLTNKNLDLHFQNKFYGSSEEFIEKVFSQFGYQDIKKFFNELGILFYTEPKKNKGKIFPITDKAKNVHKLLIEELRLLNVDIVTDAQVEHVEKKNGFFKIKYVLNSGEKYIQSKLLLLSAGGKAYPQLGTKGDGYDFAKNLGHKIIKPIPSGVPLKSKNPFSYKISGLTLDAAISVKDEHKNLRIFTDELMFTKYGFSGPVALAASRIISVLINRNKKSGVKVLVDFCPDINVSKHLKNIWKNKQQMKTVKSLYGLVPARFAKAFLEAIWIEPNRKIAKLEEEEKERIISKLKNFKIDIQGTLEWERAKFSAGGVDTKEVEAETLRSKLIDNLYFSGEILDVDGAVGGYNLSWAWSSGVVAGMVG